MKYGKFSGLGALLTATLVLAAGYGSVDDAGTGPKPRTAVGDAAISEHAQELSSMAGFLNSDPSDQNRIIAR